MEVNSLFHYLEKIVTDMLANPGSTKCLYAEDGSRFFKFASLIFEDMDVKDPQSLYLREALRGFRKSYGSRSADVCLYYVFQFIKVAQHLQPQLLNADLARDFRHKGYKSMKGTQLISAENYASTVDEKSTWKQSIFTVLNQTVVISEIHPALCDLREQEFWDCLYQLTSVLTFDDIVVGQGQIEKYCIDVIEKKIGVLHSASDVSYRPPILETFQRALQHYIQHVSPYHGYIESSTMKMKILTRALDIASVVVNIDCFIQTGRTDNDNVDSL
ncbi:hypothetical protein MAR_016472 [Mya arenaria]|uniref:Uncharacterized protein n=1 Tax=Mya arenaria TaxID=6604 RepID=A0ABY7FJY2_MYAAR|nr:hypothetical protein MAR_016472 [Mya arenaria]